MWPLNNFPSAKVGAQYGFAPTSQWLDHVRLSAVRLAGGCSGSFVSPQGLVLTNHHCAAGCIQSVSSKDKDYIAQGFQAATLDAELKCPGYEINQLVEITNVTQQVLASTRGKQGQAYSDARKATLAQIEKACAPDPSLRCEVVTLYGGGRYDLYRYRRFQDIRLAFAPEKAIAFFGGDPDNFMFPRYDLDMSLLRVYDGGQPLKTEHFLKWSANGAQPGMLTFTAGHPGSTQRQRTVSQLAYLRDVSLPRTLMYYSEVRGLLTEYQQRGAEQARHSTDELFGIENSLKALQGEHEALVDSRFFGQKEAEEKEFRAKVAADPRLKAQYGSVWDQVSQAVQRQQELAQRYNYLEAGRGFFGSSLFTYARQLVRAADELAKPNGQRLPAYSDARLPQLKQSLLGEEPVYPELETELLTLGLTKLREALSPDDPAVRAIFGKRSPREIATTAIAGTKLADNGVRKALFEGGAAALAASPDPMIALAKLADPYARAVRKQFEDEVTARLDRAGEQLGQARFAASGDSIYPDATFSLRLSYGTVKGYVENGRQIGPMTIVGGAYERATGSDPFALPPSWLTAKDKLNLQGPMNFVSTNDIIGGNSGSPVIDQQAQIIGLIFDGNIHSLGGAFGFDPILNRAVAVHSNLILEALDKVYDAQRLLKEIRP